MEEPAIAKIKRDPPGDPELLPAAMVDKGFNLEVLSANYERLSSEFLDLVLANPFEAEDVGSSLLHGFYTLPYMYPLEGRSLYSYSGLPLQNGIIDSSIKRGNYKQYAPRYLIGVGAARQFLPAFPGFPGVPTTKAIVLGAGPAGILAAQTLCRSGFSVTILEKSDNPYGIWRQENVAELSKNNPFNIEFFGETLTAAPGGGDTVVRFLSRARRGLVIRYGTKVKQVVPGDLDHLVITEERDGNEYIQSAPIVINCLGNGKPLEPTRQGYMETEGNPGIRWQQVLTEEKCHRKTLVFVGLGNSTAEMLVQLERFRRKADINYFVLTHHSAEAIRSPEKVLGEKSIFRDIGIPNLTGLSGDLDEIRAAYFRAVAEKRIITNVTGWKRTKNGIAVKIGLNDRYDFYLTCDQLYTLIGYGQNPEFLERMGMSVTDEYLGTIAYDYDGEIQRQPGQLGRGRVYPGYFGLGAILKSPYNKNAEVIPGILFRLYDLVFTASIRALEAERIE